MRKYNLLFLSSFLLAFGASTAHAKVCLLPYTDACQPEIALGIEEPEAQPATEDCTGTGEYKTLADCQKNIDTSKKCTQSGNCFIRVDLCPEGSYPDIETCNKMAGNLGIPTYSGWECQKVEATGCWKPEELCSAENKATANAQGYKLTEEEAIKKTGAQRDENPVLSGNDYYCVQFINEACNLWQCTKAEIGFHWVREEAQKRNMYLDCTKSENAEYCDNQNDRYSCQAGAEKHCKTIGSKMASRVEIYKYMDYINAKWKKWFPQHRDSSYNGWAMIFSQAYGYNLVPIFQVSDSRYGGDFFDTSGANSTGCSLIDGNYKVNEDAGYYICIKEVAE